MGINPLQFQNPKGISPSADFGWIGDVANTINDYRTRQDAAKKAQDAANQLDQQQPGGRPLDIQSPVQQQQVAAMPAPPPIPPVTQQPPLAALGPTMPTTFANRFPPLNQLGQPFLRFQ